MSLKNAATTTGGIDIHFVTCVLSEGSKQVLQGRMRCRSDSMRWYVKGREVIFVVKDASTHEFAHLITKGAMVQHHYRQASVDWRSLKVPKLHDADQHRLCSGPEGLFDMIQHPKEGIQLIRGEHVGTKCFFGFECFDGVGTGLKKYGPHGKC